MLDGIYNEPRLARLYDQVDGDRDDLDLYLGIAAEFEAGSVLDVGCGSGTLACLLAARGITVTGVDPAAASLEVARAKPGAERVRWLLGDATGLPGLQVDLATMTGNVGQVFLADGEWLAALRGIHAALRPGGHLAFEVRDPARQAWLGWTREKTYASLEVPGAGRVETWIEVPEVRGEYVTYRTTYVFASDGVTMNSESTLRFRSRPEIEGSLQSAGYALADVRDAPDRPGLEWIFIAGKP